MNNGFGKTTFALMALWLALGPQAMGEENAETVPALRKVSTRNGTFVLGKRPYPEGTREQWIAEGRVLGAAPEGMLPRKRAPKGAADNRQYLPPIGNQGSEGSCVHWAGTYYAKTAAMKRRQPALNVNAASNQCSPRFTYNLSNAGQDNGGYGHEPFEIFMRYGVPSLAQRPYVAGQYSALPSAADFVEGLHRRTTNYVWVWQWNPSASQINELKAYLDEGGVAVAGVYSSQSSFDNWRAGDAPWSGAVCAQNNIDHMVAVVGYGAGYYLIANSWGTGFGSNGYIHVASAYFEKYFSDVMYPLEGTYEPATSHAVLQINHGRRSDVRNLSFSVNGVMAWSNSPLPKTSPFGGGTFDVDNRSGLNLAVDLSSASWSAADNVVLMRCADRVSGTSGTVAGFSVRHNGGEHAASGVPVSIPDNNAAGVGLSILFSGGSSALAIVPSTTNLPSSAANGRQISVAASSGVSWAASRGTGTWITYVGGTNTGNGVVSFNVASNAAETSRTGTILVAGGGIVRTCVVVQAGTVSGVPALGEAVDAPNLVWTTGGAADWYAQTAVSYDGVGAARSGPISHSQQTWMETTVSGPGTLSFWWRASSEPGYDYLIFSVNGAQEGGGLSGSTAWAHRSHSLPAGTHVLRWTYEKDWSVSSGQDCGWVDQVRWISGTGMSPSGGELVEERRPEFSWPSTTGATWYLVWLERNGAKALEQWVQGITLWTPPTDLPAGSYRWWVRPWGTAIGGYGAWSSTAAFTILARVPDAVAQIAPTGAQASSALTYRWTKDSNATWYRLWVGRTGAGTFLDRWHAASGEGEGSLVVSNHPQGSFTWWIRGWGPDGEGPWSGPMSFSTPDPGPAKPTLSAPLGTASSPVTFSYASARAEWFRVYVQRGSTLVADVWTQSASHYAGTLPSGAYSWWIGAWNSATRTTVWSDRGDFSIP